MADSKKKTRIFYPNRVYVVDKENYIINQGKSVKELAEKMQFYDPTDTVLAAFSIDELKKYIVKKIDKITFNFENKHLIIEGDDGATVVLNSLEYEKGDYELDEKEMKGWQKMYENAKASAKSVEIIGVPPIEGTYLEYDRDD